MRWSLNGSFDPNQCVQGSADSIHVLVYDAGGGFVGEWAAPCRDFSTRIDLEPGRYTADAFLQGAAGQRTTAVAIDPFTILAGTDLTLDIDFPASSFLSFEVLFGRASSPT